MSDLDGLRSLGKLFACINGLIVGEQIMTAIFVSDISYGYQIAILVLLVTESLIFDLNEMVRSLEVFAVGANAVFNITQIILGSICYKTTEVDSVKFGLFVGFQVIETVYRIAFYWLMREQREEQEESEIKRKFEFYFTKLFILCCQLTIGVFFLLANAFRVPYFGDIVIDIIFICYLNVIQTVNNRISQQPLYCGVYYSQDRAERAVSLAPAFILCLFNAAFFFTIILVTTPGWLEKNNPIILLGMEITNIGLFCVFVLFGVILFKVMK